ncbi:hypothetical protein LZ906_016350 (plasmid) [Paraclostridium ghonii]
MKIFKIFLFLSSIFSLLIFTDCSDSKVKIYCNPHLINAVCKKTKKFLYL